MKFITALTTLALIIILISGCGETDSDSAYAEASSEVPATSDNPATEAVATSGSQSTLFTAQDLQGNTRTADEWIGKQPVVINFWGTWCPPCRREIPELAKLYAEYKDKGVEIIGVALERSAGPDQVARFASQNSMDWVLLMGNEAIAETYQIRSVPMLVLYDASGKEVDRLIGLHSPSDLKKAFESII